MTKKILIGVSIWLLIVGLYHTNKSLPATVGHAGPVHQVQSEDVVLFADRTYVDDEGVRQSEQQVFDEAFRMIEEAQHYVLIDMFFYSDFTGVATSSYRNLSSELTNILIEKKEENPDIIIQVITDPINVMYGGHVFAQFERLREAGVTVIITDLKPLRDSNPLYSTVWRTFFQWFGVSSDGGWLPNPLDQDSPKLGLRTYLKMLNYKANHRKVIVTDYDREGQIGFSTFITSANPHDGSSAHSNIAMRIDEDVWRDVLASEREVAWWSDVDFILPSSSVIEAATSTPGGTLDVQLLTENAIERAVIASLDSALVGDQVDIAMFYIADRDIIKAIENAAERGVKVRLLFDPNKDAFGREKNGMPNRQVAHELVSADENITVRWCDTHGEQCHSKLYLKTSGEQFELIQGSANYTKRNLDDLNLETNVRVMGATDETIYVETRELFTAWWQNEEGKTYSVEYEAYEDTSWFKTMRYRFKEYTGLSRW